MTKSLPEYKLSALASRRLELIEEYDAVNADLGRTRDEADQLKLKRKQQHLEKQIAEIDRELDLSPAARKAAAVDDAKAPPDETLLPPPAPFNLGNHRAVLVGVNEYEDALLQDRGKVDSKHGELARSSNVREHQELNGEVEAPKQLPVKTEKLSKPPDRSDKAAILTGRHTSLPANPRGIAIDEDETDLGLDQPSDRSPGDFIDRAAELHQILDSIESDRLITIEGWRGLGKTRLLIEARSRLEERGWFVCLIDLNRLDRSLDGYRRGVLRMIADSVNDSTIVFDDGWHSTPGALEWLAAKLVSQAPNIAMLMDGAEIEPKDVWGDERRWMIDEFVLAIDQANASNGDRQVRYVLSGRHFQGWGFDGSIKQDLYPNRRIILQPFSLATILRELRKRCDARKLHLSPSAQNRTAHRIYDLSSGYPPIVTSLLADLPISLLASDTVYRYEKTRLFSSYSEDECERSFVELPRTFSDIIVCLSTFRQCDVRMIELMMFTGGCDWVDPEDVFRTLMQYGFARWDQYRIGYFIHPIPRRLLCQRLWLKDASRAELLNAFAINYYQDVLAQVPDSPSKSATALIEYLYHIALDLQQSETPSREAIGRFQHCLATNLEHHRESFLRRGLPYEEREMLKHLLGALQDDDELKVTLGQMAPDLHLKDWLDPLVTRIDEALQDTYGRHTR